MSIHEYECLHAYSNDILGNPKIIYVCFFKELNLVEGLAGKT